MSNHIKGRVIVMLPDNLTEKEARELLLEDGPKNFGKPKIFVSGASELLPTCLLYILDVRPGTEITWVEAMRDRGLIAYREKEKRIPGAFRKTHLRLRN